MKKAIKKFLRSKGLIPSSEAVNATELHTGWYHMPVPIGMGVQGIPDFYAHYKGWFFVIEAKAPGKEPTTLQQHQLKATEITGAKSFVIDSEAGLDAVADWFWEIDSTTTQYPPLPEIKGSW